MVLSHPSSACSEVKHKSEYNQSSYTGDWFLLIDADDCDFDDKVNWAKISRHKQVKENMFDCNECGGFYGLMTYAGTFQVNLMFP